MNTEKTKKDSPGEENKPGNQEGSAKQHIHAKGDERNTKKDTDKEESSKPSSKKHQLDQPQASTKNEKINKSKGEEDMDSPHYAANMESVKTNSGNEKERGWDTLNQFQGNEEQIGEEWQQAQSNTYAGQPTDGSYAQSRQYGKQNPNQQAYSSKSQFGGGQDYRTQSSGRGSSNQLRNQQQGGFQNQGKYEQENGNWNNYGTQRFQDSQGRGQHRSSQNAANNQNLFAHENNGRNMRGQYSDYENPWISDNEYNGGPQIDRQYNQQSGQQYSGDRNQSERRNMDYQSFGSYPESDYYKERYNPDSQSNYNQQGYTSYGQQSGFPNEADYYHAQSAQEFGYAAHDQNPGTYNKGYGQIGTPRDYRNQGEMSNIGNAISRRHPNYNRPGYEDYNYYGNEQSYDRNRMQSGQYENNRYDNGDYERLENDYRQNPYRSESSYSQQQWDKDDRPDQRNSGRQGGQRSRQNHDTW